MDNRTENVDQFFEKLRETPAMSVGELEKIVAKREVSEKRRPAAVWGGVAGLLILAGIGALLMQSDDRTDQPMMTATEAPSHTPRRASELPVPADSMAEATPSEFLQQQSSKQVAPARRKSRMVRGGRRYVSLTGAPEPRRDADEKVHVRDNAQSMSFGGSKLIELTKEELAAIGVRVNEEGRVEYYNQYQAVTNRKAQFDPANGPSEQTEGKDWVWSAHPSVRRVYRGAITDSTVDTYMSEPIIETLELGYPTFFPSHVTDLQGTRRSTRMRGDLSSVRPWSWESMLQISKTIDSGQAIQFRNPLYITRLIPIRVRTGVESRDVILWYHPHTRVLGSLPHRVQLQLRDEMESIEAGIPSGDTGLVNYRKWISRTRYELDSILAALRPAATNIDEEDPAVTGSCYLSFCTITSGGVNGAPIFPNPAHDAVTIGYRLLGPRVVTITLHDINGAPVRHLVGPHPKNAGRWETRASLVGVKPGIYLVVIATEKGEQVVQRVIVD